MLDLRPVFFIVGLMISTLGIAMFIPMIVDLLYNDYSWRAFGISGILTALFGGSLALSTYTPNPDMRAREAFLLTVLSWVSLSIFAAVPFIMEPLKLSITDALFRRNATISTRELRYG